MTNIYEIAEKAKVSHMTVSRVFNNPDLVSAKTREKILKIANQLNYRPSQIARSMRTKKTNYIGFVLPDITDPFYPEIVRGVEDYARKNNYNIILVNTYNDYSIQNSSLNMFMNRGIDGIIICGIAGGKKDKEFINMIKSKKIPVILVDRYIPDFNCSYIAINNFKAGYDATNYLISLGHKKIGVISAPQKIKIYEDRLKGYKKALLDNNIEYNENNVIEGLESIESGYQLTKEMLDNNKDITSIFCLSDFIALGLYKYFIESNIRIPNEISVMGIDDIYASSIITPRLTTMAQKKYLMGFEAAKIIIDSIKKDKIPRKKLILDAELVIRESCKRI